MDIRIVRIIQEGLSQKFLATVATALVTSVAAFLTAHSIHLGVDQETALVGVVVTILTGLVGYLVPEKTV